MSQRDFKLAATTEMDLRREWVEEFHSVVFEQEERPWFVSDDACLYDIYEGEESDLVDRCLQHYGVNVMPAEFLIPVWRLLDVINSKRTG